MKAENLHIILLGNYGPDRQESMMRFTNLLAAELKQAGAVVEIIQPEVVVNRRRLGSESFIGKWAGNIDKYLFGPILLHRRIRRAEQEAAACGRSPILHVCDHSNALYIPRSVRMPTVQTCHDMLAVRGAMGEATDCPASRTGRYLQRWILRGLARADLLVSVSDYTRRDLMRLLDEQAHGRLTVIPNFTNPVFENPDPEEDVAGTLSKLGLEKESYILHVGSNLKRKNREGVLRVFAQVRKERPFRLVLAGPPLNRELEAEIEKLGVATSVQVVESPDNRELKHLYQGAFVFLFPSRFEGFGWPLIEAQSLGCPVVCSRAGPFPEVVGDSALIHEISDESSMARDILSLVDSGLRSRLLEKGIRNVKKFSRQSVVSKYFDAYFSLLPK